jgi:hypothetical protein
MVDVFPKRERRLSLVQIQRGYRWSLGCNGGAISPLAKMARGPRAHLVLIYNLGLQNKVNSALIKSIINITHYIKVL